MPTPFALFNSARLITSASSRLGASFCMRGFSQIAGAAGAKKPNLILPKAPDFKTQFVEIADQTLKSISEIAKKVAGYNAPITVPSERFLDAVSEAQEVIKKDDDDVFEAVENFNQGKLLAVYFNGRFDEVAVETIFAQNQVNHLPKEGLAPDFARADKIMNGNFCNLLFAQSLVGNSAQVTDADLIESTNAQYPHVDFSENDLGKGRAFQANCDIIFFNGLSQNPHPNILTGAIPASVFKAFLLKKEIEFLSQKNFVKILTTLEGVEYDSKPFKIIDGNLFNWDCLAGLKVVCVTPDRAIKEQEIFDRINQISAFIIHNQMVPMAMLDKDTKALMRNYGANSSQENVLHFRIFGPSIGDSGVMQYPETHEEIFAKKDDGRPPRIGQEPRTIVRYAFSSKAMQEKNKGRQNN